VKGRSITAAISGRCLGFFNGEDQLIKLAWPKFLRRPAKDRTFHDGPSVGRSIPSRRQIVYALSAVAGGGALSTLPQGAVAQDGAPPKRALTGRDASGKSVFKAFEVTSKVVNIDANPGLTFYENYITEGVPQLTGLEPDPMLKGTRDFPPPGGTLFRLINYPPRRPEGYKPPPGVTMESGLRELSEKCPAWAIISSATIPAFTPPTPSTMAWWCGAR
jgi:hypothetical protein